MITICINIIIYMINNTIILISIWLTFIKYLNVYLIMITILVLFISITYFLIHK